MINVDLLQRTLAYIEAHPEEWGQRSFRCGTSTCFAGHAALLSGAEWYDHYSELMLRPDGSDDIVRVVASAALGLKDTDVRENHKLFSPENSLDDLRRIVAELIASAA